MRPIISHVDMRVRHRKKAEAFYQRIFDVLGGMYGENYYAVIFNDPDGNPLEVVCYEAED
ncbi:MAG TPA: hypothetical protein VGG22_08395 [Candidatus Baltobacteraceae bacterium]|jgi:catechol-2,3-dioxygenase